MREALKIYHERLCPDRVPGDLIFVNHVGAEFDPLDLAGACGSTFAPCPGQLITGMAVAEKLPGLRGQIDALPHSPTARFAKFPDYVLALFSAQLRYTFAVTPPEPLPELLAQATARRDVLIADAKALVARGL